jgi:hypothetical protein
VIHAMMQECRHGSHTNVSALVSADRLLFGTCFERRNCIPCAQHSTASKIGSDDLTGPMPVPLLLLVLVLVLVLTPIRDAVI